MKKYNAKDLYRSLDSRDQLTAVIIKLLNNMKSPLENCEIEVGNNSINIRLDYQPIAPQDSSAPS